MFTRVSHIGVVVRDIDEALNVYTNILGFSPPTHRMDVPELGFRNAMLHLGDVGIELMETTDPNNEFGRFLERHGEGLYHICLVVDDIDAQIKSLRAKGADVLEVPPSESIGLKRGFVRRRSARGVLIEMVQA